MNVMKTAEHLTRRSYKRKIIAVGLSIFSALAMFATGFASWVISSDATGGEDGNIQVGVVADKSITIENVVLSESSISFNPAAGDFANPNTTANPTHTAENGYGGRVYTDNNKFENLLVTLQADITGIENVSDMRIWLEIPAPVRAAAGAELDRDGDGTKDDRYILIPLCARGDNDAGVKIVEGNTNSVPTFVSATKVSNTSYKAKDIAEGADGYWTLIDDDAEGNVDGKWHFTYTFSFSWGSYFGEMNPSLYYDMVVEDGGINTYKTGADGQPAVDEDGNKIIDYYPGYKVSDEIETFRRTMFGTGLSDEQYAALGENAGQFKIVIEAKAAEGN